MDGLSFQPDSIGRYEILSQLGRGSMGRVYLARDPHIDRRIALKVFEPFGEFSSKDQGALQQRFVLEARAAGRISHPGVVTIFDAATDKGTGLAYIAMEWVEGASLDRLVKERGRLPIAESLDIVHQVALALAAAHREGLVHRDVKPGNILIDREGRAKVTDFGIAKLASLDLTMTGWIPGSPYYMSPEHVRSETVDGRSDLFSLGVVFYQCLTGRVPFESDSLAGITYKILEIDPRPMRLIRPAISAELEEVLETALAKNPEDRFQSCRVFAEALEVVAEGTESDQAKGPEAPTVGSGHRRPSRSDGGLAGARTGTLLLSDEEIRPEREEREQVIHWRIAKSWLAWLALGFLAVNGLSFLLGLRSTDEVSGAPAAQGLETPGLEAPGLETPGAEGARQETQRSEAPAQAVDGRSGAADSPAAVAAEPRAVAPPGPTAMLHFIYKNRLKNARLEVGVDGETAWSGMVEGPKNFLARSLGRQFRTRIEVPAGMRSIEVRVTGSEKKIDLTRTVKRELRDGKVYTLQATFVPPSSLKLSWQD